MASQVLPVLPPKKQPWPPLPGAAWRMQGGEFVLYFQLLAFKHPTRHTRTFGEAL